MTLDVKKEREERDRAYEAKEKARLEKEAQEQMDVILPSTPNVSSTIDDEDNIFPKKKSSDNLLTNPLKRSNDQTPIEEAHTQKRIRLEEDALESSSTDELAESMEEDTPSTNNNNSHSQSQKTIGSHGKAPRTQMSLLEYVSDEKASSEGPKEEEMSASSLMNNNNAHPKSLKSIGHLGKAPRAQMSLLERAPSEETSESSESDEEEIYISSRVNHNGGNIPSLKSVGHLGKAPSSQHSVDEESTEGFESGEEENATSFLTSFSSSRKTLFALKRSKKTRIPVPETDSEPEKETKLQKKKMPSRIPAQLNKSDKMIEEGSDSEDSSDFSETEEEKAPPLQTVLDTPVKETDDNDIIKGHEKYFKDIPLQSLSSVNWLSPQVAFCETINAHKEAFMHIVSAAQLGNAMALLKLGSYYAKGTIVPQNDEEAKKYCKQAAQAVQATQISLDHFKLVLDLGPQFAEIYFKEIYLNDKWTTRSDTEAFECHELAADKGVVEAQLYLGNKYYYGQGIVQDFNKAFKYFKLAAAQEDPEAQNRLGFMYFHGKGVAKNLKEALKYLELAADQECTEAQAHLGSIHLVGKDVPQDFEKAIKYLKPAADKGALTAQANLGQMHLIGKGVSQDFTTALKYIQPAAEKGSQEAQCYLGWMHLKGQGVPKNPQEAIRYYKLAADQGLSIAQVSLGKIYFYGKEIAQNFLEAFKYFKLAAAQEDPEAQAFIGHMYLKGNGVDKNPQEARKYLKLAAKKENTRAFADLGMMHHYGIGVEINSVKALKYSKRAAYEGIAKAEAIVGHIYLHGHGVEKDHEQAFTYLKRAADKGDSVALYYLGEVYYNGLDGIVAVDHGVARTYHERAAQQGYTLAQDFLRKHYLINQPLNPPFVQGFPHQMSTNPIGSGIPRPIQGTFTSNNNNNNGQPPIANPPVPLPSMHGLPKQMGTNPIGAGLSNSALHNMQVAQVNFTMNHNNKCGQQPKTNTNYGAHPPLTSPSPHSGLLQVNTNANRGGILYNAPYTTKTLQEMSPQNNNRQQSKTNTNSVAHPPLPSSFMNANPWQFRQVMNNPPSMMRGSQGTSTSNNNNATPPRAPNIVGGQEKALWTDEALLALLDCTRIGLNQRLQQLGTVEIYPQGANGSLTYKLSEDQINKLSAMQYGANAKVQ